METDNPLAQALAFFHGQFFGTKPHESAYISPVITVNVDGKTHAFKAEEIAAQLGAIPVGENRYLLPAEKRTMGDLMPASGKTPRPPGPNSRTCSWPKYRKERKKRLLKPGVSPRTLMIAKEFLTGKHKNATRAARALGLIEEGKCLHYTEQRAIRKLMTDVLNEQGLTDEAWGKKALELFHAKTTKFFPYKTQTIEQDGEVTAVKTVQVIEEREIADNETQRFTWDKLGIVKSAYPKESEQASEGPAKMEIVFQQVQGADGKQGQGMTVKIGGGGSDD